MQTQRDHVHAHQFMMGRLGSALVQGDPASAEIPGRRPLSGLFYGLMAALLILGGVAVYGWIVPGGSKAYNQPGTLLVEKETGSRYVYLDGALHPVANLTTASLMLGAGMTVKLISQNSLRDLPRAAELGDGRWPQSVTANRPVAGPWLACLSGTASVGVNLDPNAPSEDLPPGRFVVVRGPANSSYLILNGRKHLITNESVLVALGVSSAPAVAAPEVWLDWLPDGVDLGPAPIKGSGSPGPRVAGQSRTVGTFFRQASGGAEQFFVLRPDGLAPISATEFLLATARGGPDPITVRAADVVAARRSPDRTLLRRLPDLTAVSAVEPGDLVLCQRQQPVGKETIRSTVVFTTPRTAAPGSRAVVAPGTGMVVVASSRGSGSPQVTYISDNGVAYPVADADSLRALRLDSTPVPFPAGLLAVLPKGPSLSQRSVISTAGK
jgi:type VII secretion protein EccB